MLPLSISVCKVERKVKGLYLDKVVTKSFDDQVIHTHIQYCQLVEEWQIKMPVL